MKNNNFDLRKFLTENKTTVNEQVASQAIQEFIAADNNGVSIAEFVKAIIDGAAEFNQEDAAYQDLDKRSEVILKAIGRQDLIGDFAVPTNEESKPIREYSDDDDEQEWREEFPEAIKYSWEWDDEGVEAVDGHIDNLFSRGAPDISKEEAMEMMGRPDDETKKAFNQAFITQMQNTDDTGGQYDDYQYTINLLYAYEKTYGEPFNTNLIKFLSPYKDAKPKTYDEYKKYVSNLLGKEISEGSKNFDLKKFLTENKLTSNRKK